MKPRRACRSVLVAMLLGVFAMPPAQAQTAQAPGKTLAKRPATATADTTALQTKIEAYLRKLYAWGPSFRVTVGPLTDAPTAGFYKTQVEVGLGDQSDVVMVYVTKDGRYMFRAELDDMNADPFVEARSKIRLPGNPFKGPADARVVVVEYSDFQCPTCRQLHQMLKELVPRYPQVRFVFKDFPLTQIHPWALTAAIGARCTFQQNPAAFWKVHDAIFDNQDALTPQNIRSRLLDFAQAAGVDPEPVRTCLAAPDAARAVQANIREAQSLRVGNTPTVFVNGRRLIGADANLLQQYIEYELARPALTN